MLGCEVQRLSEPGTEQSASFDGVLSLIGLVGAVIGNGSLVCSVETAYVLSSRLLMAEFSSVDAEVLDAVGEITNMIIGGFKTLLETRVGRVQMSIPTVIYGKNIATRNSGNVAAAARCAFPGGEITLKIRLAARPSARRDMQDL
jgi:chemotaxis protein CheX